MTPSPHALALARTLAFALTGAVLLLFAALVLLSGPEALRHAWWSWVAGVALFLGVLGLGAAGGPRARAILWDEAAQADHARSQAWAYLLAILLIFPGTAAAIWAGLDPLRGFVGAALLVGAAQLLLFAALDRMGR